MWGVVMEKRSRMSLRLAVVLAATLLAGSVSAAEIDPPIRLPGITRSWGDPSNLPFDAHVVRALRAVPLSGTI